MAARDGQGQALSRTETLGARVVSCAINPRNTPIALTSWA